MQCPNCRPQSEPATSAASSSHPSAGTSFIVRPRNFSGARLFLKKVTFVFRYLARDTASPLAETNFGVCLVSARTFPIPAPNTGAEGASLDMARSNKTTQRQGFKIGELIVYPAHGVGQIVSIEEQEIAGTKLELFVINFAKDRMRLRFPTNKSAMVG